VKQVSGIIRDFENFLISEGDELNTIRSYTYDLLQLENFLIVRKKILIDTTIDDLRNIFKKPIRDINLPRAFKTRNGEDLFLRINGLPKVIYSSIAFSAFLPNGTIRCLLPLPKTFNKSLSKSISVILRPSSSDILNPAAYNNSKHARFRNPRGVFSSADSMIATTSSIDRIKGNFLPTFSNSKSDAGL
jgi:hypothetical protein